jgi:hypothetical protein
MYLMPPISPEEERMPAEERKRKSSAERKKKGDYAPGSPMCKTHPHLGSRPRNKKAPSIEYRA